MAKVIEYIWKNRTRYRRCNESTLLNVARTIVYDTPPVVE